nr:TonB-dependent receptor plug domain-containing protein [Flavobacterium anhuiense]
MVTDSDFICFGWKNNRSKKMNQINPNDIESMKVLKPNEGKLLYGDQGANGVITVTRKK